MPTELSESERKLCQINVASDIGELAELLASGTSPDILDELGQSPLYRAIVENRIDILELLLVYNANPNFADSQEYLPLYGALEFNNVEAVKLLLRYNADLSAKLQSGDRHMLYWLLIDNLQESSLSGLLKNDGFQLHSKDQYGATLLHWASAAGKTGIVQALIHYNVGLNEKSGDDGGGLTPLHFSLPLKDQQAALKCMQILLENNADPNIVDDLGQTPLHVACKLGYGLETIKLLVEQYNADICIRDNNGKLPIYPLHLKLRTRQNLVVENYH